MLVPFGCLRGTHHISGKAIEVSDFRLRQLLTSMLHSVEVDEGFYRKTNPDVDEKISAGEFVSAKMHYIAAGYFEDRLPRPIAVDESWYLKEYPDVAEAVARRTFLSGSHHFNAEGFREGRLPTRDWTLAGGPKSFGGE
jgi:hypothetical protein